MLGWMSLATASASRRKRATNFSSSERCSARTLTETVAKLVALRYQCARRHRLLTVPGAAGTRFSAGAAGVRRPGRLARAGAPSAVRGLGLLGRGGRGLLLLGRRGRRRGGRGRLLLLGRGGGGSRRRLVPSRWVTGELRQVLRSLIHPRLDLGVDGIVDRVDVRLDLGCGLRYRRAVARRLGGPRALELGDDLVRVGRRDAGTRVAAARHEHGAARAERQREKKNRQSRHARRV